MEDIEDSIAAAGGERKPRPTVKRALEYSSLVLIFLLVLSLNPPSIFAEEIRETKEISSNPTLIEHTPILEFTYGENLEIRAQVKEEIDWLSFFYRSEGIESFQARTMQKLSDGSYLYIFDTSALISAQFDYYLAARSKERMIYFPDKAAEEFFQVKGKVEEPLAKIPIAIEVPPEEEEEKVGFPLSVSGNASIGQTISEEAALASEEKTVADGNMRLATMHKRGDFEAKFDSNVSYSNHPFEGDDEFNLSNLSVSLTRKKHHLSIGDVFVSESGFTIDALSRRGMEYTFNDEKLSFHLFNISSEQEKGWGGIIPKPSLRFYGGGIGYSFFNEMLSLRAVYLAGKDDPREGENVAGPFLEAKEGEVFSWVPELKLFQDKLHLRAELAQSRYDDDLEDEEGKKKDEAWSVGSTLSYPAFTLGANYRHIGKDFNSVGNQLFSLFTSDREGYDASLQVPLEKLGFEFTYKNEEDNVDDDPTYLTSYEKGRTATVSWDVSERTFLSLGYGESKQETFEGVTKEVLFDETSIEDTSAGVSFVVSPEVSLNLSLMNSDLTSLTDPSRDTSTGAYSVGGSFRLGENLSLSPSLGSSTSKAKVSGIKTKTQNSYLSGELTIIPELLSLSTTGSLTRAEQGQENTTTDYTNISASLNWNPKWRILGLEGPLFSLRWDSDEMKSASSQDKSERFMLELHSSF